MQKLYPTCISSNTQVMEIIYVCEGLPQRQAISCLKEQPPKTRDGPHPLLSGETIYLHQQIFPTKTVKKGGRLDVTMNKLCKANC